MLSNFLRRSTSVIQYVMNNPLSTKSFSTFTSSSLIYPPQIFSNNYFRALNINFIQTRGRKRCILQDSMEKHRIYQYDMEDGKRTEAPIVYRCFYRLHWGCWIRTRGGRTTHLFKKSGETMRKLRKHVMCNAQQSTLLDKLTLRHAKMRHYYPDDPYEPYHSREEFRFTRRDPLPASKNVEQFLD